MWACQGLVKCVVFVLVRVLPYNSVSKAADGVVTTGRILVLILPSETL